MHTILIFSDSRYRDSFGSAWLKYNVKKLLPDALVLVASFNYWREAIESLKPHLVVINHIQGKRNKMIASYVKRHGGLVVVQYNEGVIEFDGRDDVFAQQKGARDVDKFLCWNQRTSTLVGGLPIGSPRFDIYTKELRGLIDHRGLFCDKYGLDHTKEIILFGSSFPSGKFTYMLQKFHVENWKDLGNTKADTWKDPMKFAEQQQSEQNKFKSIMLATALERPDSHIVFSPHPMSDVNMWRRWCLGEEITMIDQEYVFNSINACDLYVGKTGALTVAEAWMLGKPVVRYSAAEPSASSRDQVDVDSFYATHIRDALNLIMYKDDWRGEEPPQSGVRLHYLQGWGLAPNNAGMATADIIKVMLGKHDPQIIGDVDHVRFLEAARLHDSNHRGYVVDGYGNHNKAVRQSDINDWYQRIHALLE